MRSILLPTALVLVSGAAPTHAQIQIRIEVPLPPVPRLVLIQPGIQVVPDFADEVFVHRGWYWCRRPDGWYRAKGPRERFVFIETRRVPPGLIRIPPGHYRHWKEGGPRHRDRVEDDRHGRDDDRRADRHERKAWKAHKKGKGHGHDHR